MKAAFFIIIFSSLLSFSLSAQSDFGLEDISGNKFNLQNIKKENILLVFWASWCPECKIKIKTTLPTWNDRPDLQIILINTDADPSRQKYTIKKESITLPNFRDPSQTIMEKLNLKAIPAWALYRKNTLIDAQTGFEEDRILKHFKN